MVFYDEMIDGEDYDYDITWEEFNKRFFKMSKRFNAQWEKWEVIDLLEEIYVWIDDLVGDRNLVDENPDYATASGIEKGKFYTKQISSSVAMFLHTVGLSSLHVTENYVDSLVSLFYKKQEADLDTNLGDRDMVLWILNKLTQKSNDIPYK